MTEVKVRYFAVFREERGVSHETISTEAQCLAELYAELRLRHSFRLAPELVRFAVDGAYVDGTAALVPGVEVVLIPPVAGG